MTRETRFLTEWRTTVGAAGRHGVVAAAVLALVLAACADDDERVAAGVDTAAAVAPPAVPAEDCTLGPAQVKPTGVGIVQLGMPADELRRRCAATDTMLLLGEGLVEPGLVVHVGKATAVALTTDAGTVERVLVPVRGPTTIGGVGVGSRLVSVRARHGRLCPRLGEGRVVVTAAGLPGVSFATNADYGRFADDTGALRDGDLPRATRVTELWIHGDSSACADR